MWDPKRAEWEATYFETQRQPEYLNNVAGQIKDFELDVAGRSALDIGCGPGAYIHFLLKQNPKRIVGLDISPYYTKKIVETDRGAECLQGSATELPFADNSFDLVLLLNTLLHVNPKRALSEAKRVLRPGGVLWVSHNLPTYYWWKIRYRQGRSLKLYIIETLSSLKRLAEPLFGCKRRSPYTSRKGFARLLAPLRIEKESFITGAGLRCQIVVLARKPS